MVTGQALCSGIAEGGMEGKPKVGVAIVTLERKWGGVRGRGSENLVGGIRVTARVE